MQKKRFLILRNYTVEPIFDELKYRLENKNFNIDFHYSSYDSAFPDLLKINDDKLKRFDGTLIFFSLESFFKNKKTGKSEVIINHFLNSVKNIISYLKNKNVNNVYFFYFTSNKLIEKYFIKSILKKIKKQFSQLVSNNVKVFNLSEEIILYDNKEEWIDKKYWNYSMFPFNGFGLKLVSNIIFLKLKEILKLNLKTIILDADNTLWNGIIDEVGFKKINFLNKKNKINYITFQKKLKKLLNKGVLLCLCTKNDLKLIKDTFNYHKKRMRIEFKDFLIVKANWKPKAINIKEIQKELNLSIDNSLFIDDSVFEIDSINNLIPNLDTINFFEYKNFHSNIDKIIYSKDSNNTKEDKNRSSLYQQEFKRKKEKLKFINFNNYIKNLKINIKIKINSKKNIPRLSQLSLRTNQFNSNFTRLSEKEVKNLINDKDQLIYQCEATDKFGDYGIIGMSIIGLKNNKSEMQSFIMSCRALGREIEKKFFNFIRSDLKKKKYKKIIVSYRKNEKNKLVKDFFDKNCKKIKQSNKMTYYSVDTKVSKKSNNIIKIIYG